jgi:hypothetical protein
MFRQSNQNLRIINLIDEHGNLFCEVHEGRMNVISHQSVLHALEHRASDIGVNERSVVPTTT